MKINYNFINGAFVEIIDKPKNKKKYDIEFIDKNTNTIIYDISLNVNHWAKSDNQKFTNWLILIKYKNKIIFKKESNINNIVIDITSLYYENLNDYLFEIDKFRIKNNLKYIYCYTHFVNISTKYNKIKFINNINKFNFVVNIKHITNIIIDNNIKPDYISIDSESMGDNIAWIPYINEYKNKNKVIVYVYSKWSKLFLKSYPNLIFISNNNNLKFNKKYILYYFNDNGNITSNFNNKENKINFRLYPLLHIAPIILNLPIKDINGKIDIPNKNRNIKQKYVVIAIQSTLQMKYWNYPNGWEIIIKYLQSLKYKIVLIDKYKKFGANGYYNEISKIKGVIDKRGNIDLSDRIIDIKYADFMITISSGLAWVAWALKTKVIMISGFTKPWNEFNTNIIRIHNNKVCNGCWNDINAKIDIFNWFNCPYNKNFECSKSITPNIIKNAINKLIN